MPPSPRPPEFLLGNHEAGEPSLEQLFPLVYEELRAVAHRQLRRAGRDHTLSTTALVHEAYLKMAGGAQPGPADRAHFLGIAARAMRQVLVDYARRYRAAKRGGAWERIELDDACGAVETQADTLLALDQALTRLSVFGERLCRVVECRYFGGMTEEETAEALAVTTRTVRRDWVKARLWLHDNLYGEADGGAPGGATAFREPAPPRAAS
jgi:RNA polymerase sigma factor (TIGR02999 family)